MEHELLLEIWTHHSPAALPLHYFMVLLVVPALGLVKGHKQQCEFPPVCQLFGQGALATHQQRPDQARVDVPFLTGTGQETKIYILCRGVKVKMLMTGL